MSDFNEATTPPPAPTGAAPQEDRTLALIVHLSGIVLGFIVPLIVWLINKDKPEKSFLNDQSKEALNFQITLLIVYVIGIILSIILIGALINLAAWVACLIFSIIGGIKANEGVAYRYPFALRLIK
ncbi:DUF4870 domain-containing protein [Luteimonas panaciterrae]|uniref:DUF4870 domain-containing protein n=1 Tax=Luteimonas panaciterrae TaxID=363885 RepID=UPI001CFA68B3|nr:DUF4870 domain-containing protein [Luteimonas panaciterrae]